jgi:16S rRNA (cytosine1402-N4)-methyltransferase
MAEVHVPVMVDAITRLLAPALRSDDDSPVLVDCTLGLGGHAAALLQACPQARLIGLDRDSDALAAAAQRLRPYENRITLVHAVYDELPEVLANQGLDHVQGILLDLGLSSLQIDTSERGFSYAQDAPLDMRMDRSQSLTAEQVVNDYPVAELARILRTWGEERFADRIAAAIGRERAVEPIRTSGRLVRIIAEAMPAAVRHGAGGHPAKRSFQALRIEVNHELEALKNVLPSAVAALDVGGRIAVLAYHSLEDRLVKQVLRAASEDRAPRGLPVVPPELRPELKLLTRGAERPTEQESADNPRARSARLRAAERIAPAPGRAA